MNLGIEQREQVTSLIKDGVRLERCSSHAYDESDAENGFNPCQITYFSDSGYLTTTLTKRLASP